MMQRLDRTWTKLSFILTFLTIIPFCLLVHPLMFLGVPGPWILSRIMTRWVRLMYALNGVTIRIEGQEHLPAGGPFVIISNHRSLLDFAAVSLLLRDRPVYVMKKELGRIPLFGPLVTHAGTLYLERNNPDKDRETMDTLVDRLREGHSTLIFPEGTRSADGSLGPFKKGAFHVALEARCPVIPLTILNSRELLQPHDTCITPGTITFRLHPALDTTHDTEPTVDELVEDCRRAIASGLDPAVHALHRLPDRSAPRRYSSAA